MNRQRFIASYKLFFGLLGLSSIVTEIAVLSERGRLVPANFFSFFTIESNLFAVIVLLVSALMIGRVQKTRFLDMVRGAATLYIAITGIVFSVLLAGLDVDLTAVPWDNIVLHYIIPFAVAVDWFFLDPPKKKVSFKYALYWLSYPFVYVMYSLIRGAFTGWYPYPFLNPVTSGYSGVAATSVGITILAAALIWIITRIERSRHH